MNLSVKLFILYLIARIGLSNYISYFEQFDENSHLLKPPKSSETIIITKATSAYSSKCLGRNKLNDQLWLGEKSWCINSNRKVNCVSNFEFIWSLSHSGSLYYVNKTGSTMCLAFNEQNNFVKTEFCPLDIDKFTLFGYKFKKNYFSFGRKTTFNYECLSKF